MIVSDNTDNFLYQKLKYILISRKIQGIEIIIDGLQAKGIKTE